MKFQIIGLRAFIFGENQFIETISFSQTWKQTFTFDRYGNRKFDAAQTTTLGNCPVNVCNPDINTANNRVTTHQFDAAGNTTIDAEGRTFFYDGENKQKEVRNASNVIIGQYFYDGDGKRIKKISDAEITIFVYDAGGKLASEFTVSASQSQGITTSYLTNDTLGSPRITTDSSGNVISRRDFRPYGEEIARANYGTDKVRQKFTSYERDIESELDFAEARYYNKNHGRFTSVDPMMASSSPANPQSWNRYIYCLNNPLVHIDPSGMSPTDFIDDQTGTRTRIEDGKDQVLAASTGQINSLVGASTQAGGRYWRELAPLENSDSNLHLTNSEFEARVATTYGESSAFRMSAGEELGNEMKAIAYVNQRNGIAYGSDNDQAKDYKKTPLSQETDKMKLGNLAVVNQVRGGPDPSNGATMWDGREQALFGSKETRTSVPNPNGKGTWELHKNTMGWSIASADYTKWNENVGSAFRAPQTSQAVRGTRNAGKSRLESTAVYGQTIFWRVTP